MSNSTLISIVTVTYNCREAFVKTLQSVERQSYGNIEYIVIDGGSTDGTLYVIEEAALRGVVTKWVSEKDRGIYDAMNKGAKLASGRWINFLNAADRFSTPDALRQIVEKLDSTSAQVVYGDHILELPYGNYIFRASDSVEGLKSGMIFCHQATFVATNLMQRELFDTTYSLSGDYNFFYRCFRAGVEFAHVPIIVVRYEAANGVSTKKRLSAIGQNARINGRYGSLEWHLCYCVESVKDRVKNLIFRFLPAYANRAKRRGVEGKSNIEKIEIE